MAIDFLISTDNGSWMNVNEKPYNRDLIITWANRYFVQGPRLDKGPNFDLLF